jgi:hypothetical protein
LELTRQIDLFLHSWFDKLTTNGGINQRLSKRN